LEEGQLLGLLEQHARDALARVAQSLLGALLDHRCPVCPVCSVCSIRLAVVAHVLLIAETVRNFSPAPGTASIWPVGVHCRPALMSPALLDQLVEAALLGVHVLGGGVWVGAMVFSIFILPPRAEQFFRREADFEDFIF